MSEAKEKPKHPKGLYVLFFTEMWERFGFYTMLAIFLLYLDEYFHFQSKGQLYGAFLALVYFTPVFGGLVADRLLGFRKTIIAGALLMAAGYGAMAIPLPENDANEEKVVAAEQEFAAELKAYEARYEEFEKNKADGEKFDEERPEYEGPSRYDRRWLFYIALSLLIIGNGLFKPNISVMVGNLYPEDSPLKDGAFNIFYMGINIGAFFAPTVAGLLRNSLGWEYAFGAAALGMVVSIIIFLAFRRHIAHAEISKKPKGDDDEEEASLVEEEQLTPEQFKARVIALLTIFGIVILFWMSFHQNGFTMTLWARDATGPIPFTDIQIPPEYFATLNPFFVVFMTPVLVAFWSFLRKRGKEPSTPGKIGWGMVLTAAAFLILAAAGKAGGDFGRVSPMWLASAYWVVTLGELCLSPMGLSFVSKVAPAKIRGLMMGGWFAATAIGNYLSGLVEVFWEDWSHSTFFGFLVLTSLFAALVLRINLKRLKAATGGK